MGWDAGARGSALGLRGSLVFLVASSTRRNSAAFLRRTTLPLSPSVSMSRGELACPSRGEFTENSQRPRSPARAFGSGRVSLPPVGSGLGSLAVMSSASQARTLASGRKRPTVLEGRTGSAQLPHIFKIPKIRPQIGRDYPLNLSILLSGGKETNKDSPSNGE